MELFGQIEAGQNKILTFESEIWRGPQTCDCVYFYTFAKKKNQNTKNVQLPFVMAHVYCAVPYTFQNKALH